MLSNGFAKQNTFRTSIKIGLSIPTIQQRLNLIQDQLIELSSIVKSEFRLRKYEMIKQYLDDVKSKFYPQQFSINQAESISDFILNIEIYLKTLETEFIILKIEEEEETELQTKRIFEIIPKLSLKI